MTVFDRQVATADRLIKKFGQVVTWVSKPIVNDPAKPWEPSQGVEVDYSVSMVFVEKFQDNAFMKYADNSQLVAGNYYGFLAKQSFIPNIKDTILREGEQLKIKDVTCIKPNAEVILYVVLFER